MQLYVWQPQGLEGDSARRRFVSVLDRVATRYTESYGEPFPARVFRAGGCFVGLVGPATGVADAETVAVGNSKGMVLAGVPEPELAPHGNEDDPREPPSVAALMAILLDRRELDQMSNSILRWRGRWAAVAWRDRRLVVTNGVSLGLRLWWTDGPEGWALGTLPSPLLAFAARPRVVNLDVATVAAALGYVGSSRSLFVGVHRFMPGDRILLQADAPPVLTRFTGFDTVLGTRRGLTYDEIVDHFARRAAAFTGAAVARSSSPRLGLSGGRDSRLLAAALVRAGRSIVASTGGPMASADVVIAGRVASALGMDHVIGAAAKSRETDPARMERARTGGGARSVPMTADRLAAWVALHDGTAPAYLAWIGRDLSARRATAAHRRGQLFSGLGGETHRGAFYPRALDIDRPGSAGRGPRYVLDLFASGSPLRRPVRDLLADELREQSDALGDDSLPLSEWMSRFYWRFRESFRHADVLAATDSVNWAFAPLMDLGFLALSREAPSAAKISNRLAEDVTARLAPQLATIPYDRPPITYPPEIVIRILALAGLLDVARDAGRRLSGQRRSAPSADLLRTLWQEIYFGPGDHLWPELIDEHKLRKLVIDRPTSAIVRDLAVPELLVRPEADQGPAGTAGN